ncbi:hypothetical protein BC629DRAFT_1058574 [Irpex lacteus]|nr:hypothetical protein BC629DRAFT_1058574 [Irpex lacteus]
MVQGATRVGAIRVCKVIDPALRRRQRKLQARYGPKYGQQLDWIQEVPEPECRDNERDGNDSDGLGNAGFLNGVVRWLLAILAAFLSVSGLDSDASSTVSSSTWAQEVFSPQSIVFTTVVDVPVGVSVTGDTPGMGDTEVLGTRSDGASPRSALQDSLEDVQHIGTSTTELVHPPLSLSSPASASVSVATIQGERHRAQSPSSSDCPRVGLDGASPRSSLQDPREDVQHIGASSTTELVHPPLTLSSSPASTPVSVATVQGERHQVQPPSLSDSSRVGVPSTSAPEPSGGVPQVSTRRTVPSSHTAREGTSRSGTQLGGYLHPINGPLTRLSGTSYQTPSGKLFLAYAQGRIDRSAKGTTRT